MSKEELRPGERYFRINWQYGVAGCKDSDAGTWMFAAAETVAPGAEENVTRRAIAEFYRNLPPEHYIVRRQFRPNWGDAIDDIPPEHWAKHGVRPVLEPCYPHFTVEHDEMFTIPEAEDDE